MRISDWSSDVCSSDLKVGLFSTGDELREPGTPPETGAIFDSNRYTIHALLTGLGCQVDDLGILPDRLDVVREALAPAEGRPDLLVTSGGVSVGGEDPVKAAAAALGQTGRAPGGASGCQYV